MCGIVGYTGSKQAIQFLMQGLSAVEYRGYDSAGIALQSPENQIVRLRAPGKLEYLKVLVESNSVQGICGIGHTRWATHGGATEENAHPHISCNLVVVQNGIVTNYTQLKDTLVTNGYTFVTDTDTEVIAHLIHFHHKSNVSLLSAIQKTMEEIEGHNAIVVMSANHSGLLFAACKGISGLVIGVSTHGNFVASDPIAFINETRQAVLS